MPGGNMVKLRFMCDDDSRPCVFQNGGLSAFLFVLLRVAMPSSDSDFFFVQIERPYMREWAAWRSMVAIMVLSCSGLVRFLLDQYPEDLPDYDPVD
jgi:hypothetical protein